MYLCGPVFIKPKKNSAEMAKYSAEGGPVRIMPVTMKVLYNYNYNISPDKKLYQCGIKPRTVYFYQLS